MATLVNKDAPYSGLSSLMALRGRGGDTELVHMSPSEVKGLASLGQLTINPDTGLPEAFKLKSLLPTIAGIGAAVATGGTSLLIPALATGLTSAVVNKDIGRGLFDGLLSYAGGSIMRGLAGGEALAGAANAGSAGSAVGATAPQTVAATGGSQAQALIQQSAAGSGIGSAAGAAPNVVAPITMYSGPAITPGAAIGAIQPPLPALGGGLGAAAIPSATELSMAATQAAAPSVPTMGYSYVPEGILGRAGQAIYGAAPAGSAVDPLRLAAATYGTPQSTLGSLTAGETARFFAPQVALPIAGEALGAAMTPKAAPYPTLEEQRTDYVPEQKTITRVPLRSTPVTQEQALAAATGETGPLRFFDYKYANKGGLVGLAEGGLLSGDTNRFFEGRVPGTEHGMKDNVAFKVKGGNIDTAMLSPGEYVIPADVVSMLGNGNGDSGAKALDQFAKGIRQKAFGAKEQQKQLDAGKELNKIMA